MVRVTMLSNFWVHLIRSVAQDQENTSRFLQKTQGFRRKRTPAVRALASDRTALSAFDTSGSIRPERADTHPLDRD